MIDQQSLDMAASPQQQMASFYQSPMNAYGSSIVQLTNPDQEISKMEMTFRGMMVDEKGNLKKVGHPLMNEKGILAITGMVQSIVNQVTILSNLEKNTVENIMKFFVYTICKDLMLNRINWDIGVFSEEKMLDIPMTNLNKIQYIKQKQMVKKCDSSSRDRIYQIALSTVFICIKRSQEGDDKRFWKGTQHENIIKVDSSNQNKGMSGLGSIFSSWKK